MLDTKGDKKMRMTIKEHDAHINCPTSYVIEYVTPYGHGTMIIKKSFWERCQKKFTKAFKDAEITSIVEINDK